MDLWYCPKEYLIFLSLGDQIYQEVMFGMPALVQTCGSQGFYAIFKGGR